VKESLPRRIRGQHDRAGHAARGPRSFSRSSGLERRWSSGPAAGALARARQRVSASRRRRGLNSAVAQIRFACQQRWLGSIDVGLYARGRRNSAEARSRDTSGGAAMAMLRDARAPIRAAPKEQQERHSKKAYQDARKGRRHIRTLCIDRALEGTWYPIPVCGNADPNSRGGTRTRDPGIMSAVL
jgi:hypothetical protein